LSRSNSSRVDTAARASDDPPWFATLKPTRLNRLADRLIAWAIDRFAWHKILSTENHVRLAYRLLLRRRADPAGLKHYTEMIKSIHHPETHVFRLLVDSEEHQRSNNPLHWARLQLIRRLPRADVVIDLGGSSRHSDHGALYLMGYPRTRRLIIVDLPPDERYKDYQLYRPEGERTSLEVDGGTVT
jgi:hypothetical protein